jgi:hypothetical protein
MAVHPAATPPAPQTLVARLEGLRSLTVTVLNTHTNHRGACAACQQTWPCEQAAEVEHNLAVL